jgi:hypothetical protein
MTEFREVPGVGSIGTNFRLERFGAELRSSHVPMLSQPQAVLDVIRNAAEAFQKSKAA